MPEGQHVKVRLICESCQHVQKLCVLVHRNVPQRIACSPGGSIVGGGGGNPFILSCPKLQPLLAHHRLGDAGAG